MPLLGQAVLAIWNDVVAGEEAEFDRWHLGEHIPERVGVPGFLRGRRYDVVDGERRYFTLYETERPEVLNGPDYLARLDNPTPWTQKCIRLFRNNKRTACRVTLSLGHGVGGAITTLDVGPAPGRDIELRDWLTRAALPALIGADGIIGAHLCEADEGVTRVQAAEKTLLDRPDELARWVVMIEGTEAAVIDRACATILAAPALTSHGAAADVATGSYRLVYSLGRSG
ncbi:MAG: hypothetical protein HYU41_00300 [Candidatus Rokubacteria bacterium]|nr:hypothetical protein [Candidatus Rokubacteria bacterium]